MKSNYIVLEAFWSSYRFIEGLTYWLNGKQYTVVEYAKAYEPSKEATETQTKQWTLLELAKKAQVQNNSKLFITEYKSGVHELEKEGVLFE